VIAALFSFISLFFLQNVFQQKVYHPVIYSLTAEASERVEKAGISTKAIEDLSGKFFPSAVRFNKALAGTTPDWNPRANDIRFNDNLRNQLSHIYRYFRVGSD